MTTAVQQAKAKILASGEGEMHSMLTHTLVWKLDGNDTNGQYAVFEMIDAAHGEPPLHSHPWEETFYILEGELEITLGNRQHVITAGAVSHIPANAVHTFKVLSAIARVLIIVSPAAAEFYREVGKRMTSLQPDLTVLQEISAKYGLQLR
ncbi:cupin domain-containing protein [Leptolyngbya sp. FACHB-671]|uniref:cupin domain-containing protein n=1 Tax=Leptolyngbya sp. FACHB-671 TaxID=2692812 RepID=UPI001684043D|nr:cupin domain-containing protein [Leptolyngbya sp. FACHB-671]MBD2066289.1 cupin domain-containing protein [Leptolyngbya sp. FACHB-671]